VLSDNSMRFAVALSELLLEGVTWGWLDDSPRCLGGIGVAASCRCETSLSDSSSSTSLVGSLAEWVDAPSVEE
jgi:hypothetical protein